MYIPNGLLDMIPYFTAFYDILLVLTVQTTTVVNTVNGYEFWLGTAAS
jgi:hypothetical protein